MHTNNLQFIDVMLFTVTLFIPIIDSLRRQNEIDQISAEKSDTNKELKNIEFAERACESLRKCVVEENDELCTLDVNTGLYMRFENKCLMLKRNCDRQGMLYQAAIEECNEDTPYIENEMQYEESNADLKFSGLSEISCRSYKECSLEMKSILCAVDLVSGKYAFFNDNCKILQTNCNGKGTTFMALATLEDCSENKLRPQSSRTTDSVADQLVTLSCESLKKCTGSQIQVPLCGVDLSNAKFKLFPDNCAFFKHNCDRQGQVILAAPNECSESSSSSSSTTPCTSTTTVSAEVQTSASTTATTTTSTSTTTSTPRSDEPSDSTLLPDLPFPVDGRWNKTLNIPLYLFEACKSYSQCRKLNETMNRNTNYYCTKNAYNDTYLTFATTCDIFRINCLQLGLLEPVSGRYCRDEVAQLKKKQQEAAKTTTHAKEAKTKNLSQVSCSYYQMNKCSETSEADAGSPICAVLLNNGSYMLLPSVCDMYRRNCEDQTKFFKAPDSHCKGLTLSLRNKVEETNTRNNLLGDDVKNAFALRACESFKACKATDTDTSVCAMNFNDGVYVQLANKCLIHKYNCDKKGMLLLVDPEKCRTMSSVIPSQSASLSSQSAYNPFLDEDY